MLWQHKQANINLQAIDAVEEVQIINNKDLLYSTGNYTQYPIINHNGKEYICITKSLYTRNQHIVNQLYFNRTFFLIKKKKNSRSELSLRFFDSAHVNKALNSVKEGL